MSEVITASGLSKKFIISHQHGYRTLGESITETGRSVLRTFGLGSKEAAHPASKEDFWALRDLDFKIGQGERVGIIGRNGAGKSTLLKILSRIHWPTAGRINIRGRVASLLEVGTGFHPELSGRENIFLNGAILGMSRSEIKSKFDAIVDFAEVEKFLDTPVKRYSSGMYVRLAFAVAAHLEPEILIVDEVLAVGDAQFQRKCLGRMQEVGKEGRTVLFVSHNMQAVRQLCDRCILLKAGTLYADGTPAEVTEKYLEETPYAEGEEDLDALTLQIPPDPAFRLLKARFRQGGFPVFGQILNGEPLEIELEYLVTERSIGFRVFFDLCDTEDTLLFRSFHDETQENIPVTEPGHYVSRATIPGNLFSPSNYELRIFATIFNVRMCIPGLGLRVPLFVERTGKANQAYLGDPIRGKLSPIIPWRTDRLD